MVELVSIKRTAHADKIILSAVSMPVKPTNDNILPSPLASMALAS